MTIQGRSRTGIVEIPCGGGIVADDVEHELLEPIWTDGLNVRFGGGFVRKTEGYAQTLSSVAAPVRHVCSVQSAGNSWVSVTDTNIYADDGITQTDITGTPLTGSQANKVTSSVLGGVLVINNGADVPRYWGGSGTTQDLPGWTSTHRCKSVRAFLNYLVAVNVTKDVVNYGSMVKWSDVAESGSIPDSWDTSDPTRDAGELQAAETDDDLVDSLPLGNVLVLYKQRSMYAMQFTRNNDIFRVFRLPGDYGMIAPNCAANVPRGHVVLTNGPDVILHYANEPQSIITGKWRDWLRENLDPANYEQSFVTANTPKGEVWICIPTAGSSYCNRALVWNYEEDTWSLLELPNVTHGAIGVLQSSDDGWEDDEATWEGDDTPWDPLDVADRLVMSSGNAKLYVMDEGDTFDGAQISASVTRDGLSFGDAEIVKLLRSITPRVNGLAGTVLAFTPRYSNDVEGAYSSGSPVSYTVGTTRKAHLLKSGRQLGVAIASAGAGDWRIKSMGWDVVPMGDY